MTQSVETKFISLDNKEACYIKVDMQDYAVFYPYFHFRPAKDVSMKGRTDESKSYKVYKYVLDIEGDALEKITTLERNLFPGKPEEYGFWTAKNSEGFFIGLGAGSMKKFFDKPEAMEARFVVLQGDDLLFIFNLKKDAEGKLSSDVQIYFSDAEEAYGEKNKEIDILLKESNLKSGEKETSYELVAFNFNKYTYSGEGKALEKVCDTHVVLPEHDKKPFKDNVEVCAWHTIVFNDNVVNEGPRFVLLKNPGLTLNNSLDKLSCWLVHRRGGFVMGEEFASNDFHQETTFIIREVDEYVFNGLPILNVECDTFTKNRDPHFESFLKNLSPARFIKV
jgi:hypothetical protein